MPIALADIHLQQKHPISLARQLYQQLHQQISQGKLIYQEQLPATRELAATLKLSRGVVVEAYDMLKQDGMVAGFGKGGTRVTLTSFTPAQPSQQKINYQQQMTLSARGQRIASSRDYSEEQPISDKNQLILSPSKPDFSLFPQKHWQKLAVQASKTSPKWYQRSAGIADLKLQLQKFLAHYRGINNIAPEQILITTGSQSALSLLMTLLCDNGDTIVTENPCWSGTLAAAKQANIRTMRAPLDREGMTIPKTLAQTPKLVVCSPAVQFPTGIRMSVSRQQSLVNRTQQWGSWLIEDDYASEYSYNHHPAPAIMATTHATNVIHVGTMSKCLMPSLRLGWMVVPLAISRAIQSSINTLGLQPSYLIQQQLALFMQYGYLNSHLANTRAIYNERKRQAIMELNRIKSDYFTVVDCISGMNVSLALSERFNGIDDDKLLAHLQQNGLGVSIYHHNHRRYLLAGTTYLDGSQRSKHLNALVCALQKLTH